MRIVQAKQTVAGNPRFRITPSADCVLVIELSGVMRGPIKLGLLTQVRCEGQFDLTGAQGEGIVDTKMHEPITQEHALYQWEVKLVTASVHYELTVCWGMLELIFGFRSQETWMA